MNAREIYLFGLIGLRALAEYDPLEYTRSTDISKWELEQQINSLLKDTDNVEAHNRFKEIHTIIYRTETPNEAAFLLQQIYAGCFRIAQYYSLEYSR